MACVRTACAGTEMTHYSWTKNVRSRSSNAPAQESAEALDAGEENNSEPESAIDALVRTVSSRYEIEGQRFQNQDPIETPE